MNCEASGKNMIEKMIPLAANADRDVKGSMNVIFCMHNFAVYHAANPAGNDMTILMKYFLGKSFQA